MFVSVNMCACQHVWVLECMTICVHPLFMSLIPLSGLVSPCCTFKRNLGSICLAPVSFLPYSPVCLIWTGVKVFRSGIKAETGFSGLHTDKHARGVIQRRAHGCFLLFFFFYSASSKLPPNRSWINQLTFLMRRFAQAYFARVYLHTRYRLYGH